MARPVLSDLVAEARTALAGDSTDGLTAAQRAARGISLAGFVRAAWPVIERCDLAWGWVLDAICEHVEALLLGHLGKHNLAIFVPPGSMKSTVVSVCAPAWRWITQPSWRAIFASGNPSVATRDSLRCRQIIESPWYRQTFGINWTLADDQNLKTRFANSATGSRVAISSKAKITGDRGDGLFVDDPIDAADTHSQAERDAVNGWYDQAFANRLNDLRRGTRCLIQQRLHPEDLAGHILAREATQWEVLEIPQVFESSRRYTTSIGWTDPRQADGELMFPVRFPQEVIDAEKLRLGESGFAGQHQQRPFSAGGEVFKVDRLQRLDAGADLPRMHQAVISLDTAFKTRETSDFSVAVVLGRFERGICILDIARGRYAYPRLREIVTQLAARWRPSAVLIEDAASGQSLIQELQESSVLPIRPIRPDGDKLTRAHVVVPTWEAGRIFARDRSPWLDAFLAELGAFPKAPHDDQVDAFVQGIRYLTANNLDVWRRLGAAATGEESSRVPGAFSAAAERQRARAAAAQRRAEHEARNEAENERLREAQRIREERMRKEAARG